MSDRGDPTDDMLHVGKWVLAECDPGGRAGIAIHFGDRRAIITIASGTPRKEAARRARELGEELRAVAALLWNEGS
jgi:hypothetical protein